jgi:hypothetical protein
VRLVFILRDPVERAFSNYLWSRMNGLEKEEFERALELEEAREAGLSGALRYARPHDYFGRGLYAKLLLPYFERFPRTQILCLRYEDLETAPGALAERLHGFLGVTPRAADAADLPPNNASHKAAVLLPATRERLQRRYAEPNRQLAQLLGPDFAGWSGE